MQQVLDWYEGQEQGETDDQVTVLRGAVINSGRDAGKRWEEKKELSFVM